MKQKENGDIIIDYRRLAGESHLRPVRYVFRPVTVQKVPEALKRIFQRRRCISDCQRNEFGYGAAAGAAND